MRIFTILIYATLVFYANTSFSSEQKNIDIFQEYLTGSIKNVIIHNKPKPIPEMKVLTNNNISKTIYLGKNKVTLVNFWATWCAPCREEMPSLQELVKSINSNNFSVVVIASGRNSQNAIDTFFEQHQLTNLLSYKDPKGKVASSLSVMGLPTTIIVDQNAYEVGRLVGSTAWNSPEVIKFIKKLIMNDN